MGPDNAKRRRKAQGQERGMMGPRSEKGAESVDVGKGRRCGWRNRQGLDHSGSCRSSLRTWILFEVHYENNLFF